jgi:hypothetical protein
MLEKCIVCPRYVHLEILLERQAIVLKRQSEIIRRQEKMIKDFLNKSQGMIEFNNN